MISVNKGVFLIACLASVALAEGILRVVYNPNDHLGIAFISDPVLGEKLPAGVNGLDANGLRNPEVPDSVDILAVGDSMTYGSMAMATKSWPAQLGMLSGKSVYNAGISGYGPLQYLHQIRTLAPELNPEQVIVMFYLYNDPSDAYDLAYSREYWKDFRRDGLAADNLGDQPSVGFLIGIRKWLQQNSMLYNVLRLLDAKYGLRLKELFSEPKPKHEITHLGRTYLFNRKYSEKIVSDEFYRKTVEGMRITKRAFGEIAVFCSERGIDLHVVLMPARLQALYPHVADQLTESQDVQLTATLRYREGFKAEMIDFLAAEGIPTTDLLAPMVRAFETQVIYPAADNHPNGEGYRVIAEALNYALIRNRSQ